MHKRHRHQEFIRFLNVINARVPKKKAVHVIVDNYAAHKHPNVLDWIAKHPRLVFHFTPTWTSWLNTVEGFFANLANKRLKRGVFRSLQLDDTNQSRLPGPSTRTKSSPPSSAAPSVRFYPQAFTARGQGILPVALFGFDACLLVCFVCLG
jgi:transposase